MRKKKNLNLKGLNEPLNDMIKQLEAPGTKYKHTPVRESYISFTGGCTHLVPGDFNSFILSWDLSKFFLPLEPSV